MFRSILLGCALAGVLLIADSAAAQGRGYESGARRFYNTIGRDFGQYYAGPYFERYPIYPPSRYYYYPRSMYGRYYYPSYQYRSYSYSPYSTYATPYYAPNTYSYTSAPNTVTTELLQANQAKIEVIVPDPNAKVTFNGAQTSSVGPARSFITPALTPGRTYTYEVRATWMQNGQTVSDVRNVSVKAGENVVVNFTQAATEPIQTPR